jgi:hypothetical protein
MLIYNEKYSPNRKGGYCAFALPKRGFAFVEKMKNIHLTEKVNVVHSPY